MFDFSAPLWLQLAIRIAIGIVLRSTGDRKPAQLDERSSARTPFRRRPRRDGATTESDTEDCPCPKLIVPLQMIVPWVLDGTG
jgi:hypothetical protein